jgi:hypothetical protein
MFAYPPRAPRDVKLPRRSSLARRRT